MGMAAAKGEHFSKGVAEQLAINCICGRELAQEGRTESFYTGKCSGQYSSVPHLFQKLSALDAHC